MTTQPDILFIFCDQWNARYLGCAGHPQVRTPNLDALAAQGCMFEAAYTPSPVCMPARVSLVSGLYPHSHGFFCNFTGRLFPAEQVTLFRALQEAGYTTAKIGKYHFHSMEWGQDYREYRAYYDQLGLNWAEETSTPYQGPFLNTAYSRYLRQHGYLEEFITDIGGRYVDGQYVATPSPLPPDMTPDGYVCRQSIEYLRRTPTERPLFLCASFPGPHTPLDAPGKYATMYDPCDVTLPENFEEARCQYDVNEIANMMALYMGKITHLDDRVGQLVDTLRQRGNWENTIVVFGVDHGDRMGEHGIVSKCGFQDGSVRVPLIIGGPAAPIRDRGLRNASPVSLLDLFPTLIELAGGEVPEVCQASSLVPILAGEVGGVHDTVFSEIANGERFSYMARSDRWKWYGQGGRECLYDMKDDPWETENLAASPRHGEIVQGLRNELLEFLMSTQLNHARGYRNLFDRLGLRFPTEDPVVRKRIICARLRQVHEGQ